MLIRKMYKIECAHKVNLAFSERCAQNYHGHSAKIEVFLKTNSLDEAGMVVDFGKLKSTVGSFIDMFDHSVQFMFSAPVDEVDFFKKHNERWIELPANPTAEMYCVLMKDCINEILPYIDKQNGEGEVRCVGVRYHETDTGYAESEESDPKVYSITDLVFSKKTLSEATDILRGIIFDIKKSYKPE